MGIGPAVPVSRVNKAPRHPEVNQQNQTAFEPNNQVLATACHSGHAFAAELGSHLCRIDRTRQPRVEDLDIVEAAAHELRLERRADSLDLRQLGHRSSVAPAFAQAIITPRMTPRCGGAFSPSSYAASTSSAAAAVLPSSLAWISARTSPGATLSPRFLRQTTPTE